MEWRKGEETMAGGRDQSKLKGQRKGSRLGADILDYFGLLSLTPGKNFLVYE